MRMCFIGDIFVHGTGDEAGLGWRGRIATRLLKDQPALTAYDLGIRRDTSRDILRRWEGEARARLSPGDPHRLAFSFGANDCADDGAGQPRIAETETIRNAAEILTKSMALAPTIMIGPLSILDDAPADRRIAARELALREIAAAHRVPFLPVFDAMRKTPDWTAGAAAGDGTHPDGAGYARLARMIWDWPAFQAWAAGH